MEASDAWFIGLIESLIVGVWVDNDDDHSSMDRVVGGSLLATIRKHLMTAATTVAARGA
ncbi:MAG TPA: hypothetical protein VGL31_01995 [Xanthobacteraceae bacterium]